MCENKYNKTVFYKIVCKDENVNEIYIGHTTNFKNRLKCHKSNCNNPKAKEYNFKVYNFIRGNGGWDNFKMVIIEECNLENKREAEEHETYQTNILDAKLNSQKPTRNKQKYREDNKEKIKKYEKQYREDNKDKIREYSSTPYECQYCKCFIRLGDKTIHFRSKKHQNAVPSSSSSSTSTSNSI